MTIHRLRTRQGRLILGGLLVLVCSILALLYAKGHSVYTASSANVAQVYAISSEGKMMTMIRTILDTSRERITYGVYVDQSDVLTESARFTFNGNEYTLILSSAKEDANSVWYATPRYLELTVTVPTADGFDVVRYIDMHADGVVDSVFYNEAPVVDDERFTLARDYYLAELLNIYTALSGT